MCSCILFYELNQTLKQKEINVVCNFLELIFWFDATCKNYKHIWGKWFFEKGATQKNEQT